MYSVPSHHSIASPSQCVNVQVVRSANELLRARTHTHSIFNWAKFMCTAINFTIKCHQSQCGCCANERALVEWLLYSGFMRLDKLSVC